MSEFPLAVFDGHNDTLLRLWQERLPEAAFLTEGRAGHLDLPRARRGGFAGGLFACYVPSVRGAAGEEPRTPDLAHAQRVTMALAARLRRLERLEALAVCRTAAEIRTAIAAGRLAAVFHIEGAEAIDPELEALEVLHAAGLRSLGPVWSRPNVFGHGVPFRFPSSPDTGPGLTEAGKELVRACNALRILIDLSHLNEQGFWDVARLSSAPLVASHSNAHALSAAFAQPHRPPARRHPRVGRAGRPQLRRRLPPRRRSRRRRHAARDRGRPHRPSRRQARHRRRRHRLGLRRLHRAGGTGRCRRPAEAVRPARATAATTRRLAQKIAHGNWLRVLERTWGSLDGPCVGQPVAAAR